MKGVFIICFCALIMLVACNKDEDLEKEVFFGYQYSPLAVGQERIFQLDSIVFDDFTGTSDTFQLQTKEVIENTFTTLEGKTAFRTLLYHRQNDTSNWVLQKVFEQSRSSIRYERRLDNKTIIQLVFPIREFASWNANALNTADELRFRYLDLHESFTMGSMQYDSTIGVLQRREQNLIQETFTEERYASGLGLVYRYDEDLELDIQTGEIQAGYKSTTKLIKHNL